MATITIRIEGLEQVLANMNYQEIVAGPLHDFLLRSALTVEAESKQLAPVDTGRLRASIKTEVEPLKATIAPTVHYGAYVEFGTRPHWPPVSALEPWARRHGFPTVGGAYLVARAISRHGTKPHPYMRPGAEAAEPAIQGYAEAMANEIETRWPSGA